MDLEKEKNKLFAKLKESRAYFTPTSALLLLFFILIRIYELAFVWKTAAPETLTPGYIATAFFYDFITLFNFLFYLGVIYLLLSLFNKKTANIFLNAAVLFLTIGYLSLVLYFSKTSIPLGADLFSYSLEEIKLTVGAAGGFNILYAALFIAIIAGIITLQIFVRKIKFHDKVYSVMLTFILLSFLFGGNFNAESNDFANAATYNALVNKVDFFTGKTTAYFFNKEKELPLSNYFLDTSGETAAFKYTDPEYPFLHDEKSENVLGNFFKKTGTKPNLVFIIVESLGRGYSGEKAYLGSFTPFLDSLAKESLYWENFLSTGGRTFAALPSIFGSLPFGEKGFLEMAESMPPHFSLIKYLKKQGYKANFYYGGSSKFDMMDVFLKKQEVNLIIDENNFGPGYKKMPPSSGGFSWGYGDKELFNRSLKELNSVTSGNSINIYLTISMHSPFLIENQDYYRNKFENLYDKLQVSSDAKNKLREYKEMLSTVLYTDDALREFFNNYKKREDFNNTIFIITGDHRMPEIPITSQADRFHVPLIIFSPLLSRYGRFSSISSQFDILPSLLALLAEKYNMEKVNSSVFIGSGLDTLKQFRSIHNYPLMRNKNELLDYVYQGYFYSDKNLFLITDNLNIVPVTDNVTIEKIETEFAEFRKRNLSMLKSRKLMPQALIK